MIKPFLLLLLVVLSGITTLSAQFPDSCAAPTLVRHHYLGSAKIIALRQMLHDPAWADSITIPAVLYDPVLQALSAVYHAMQYPERDTVTRCFNILAFAGPVSPVGITLTADSAATWAKNLHHDIVPTGNKAVDSILLQYHLKRTSSQIGGQYLFFLGVDQPINTVALAALFNNIPGAHAEADGAIGDGNNITLDTVAGGVTLTYTVGWGDCPAGCISHRSWTFLVKPDCSVQFLGVAGDELTAEVPCTTIFGCATEPLCLPWLQDSLQRYVAQHPDCLPSFPPIYATIYQDFDTDPVLGIHVVLGIDAQFTDFFYCNGDYIGSCNITIAGGGCMPESLSHYLQGDTIWSCAQPLPTPANCGSLNATSVPTGEELVFQLSPNPATTGQVWVRADFGALARGRLSVFDAFGKAVLVKTFAAAQLDEPLDLAGHSPGMGYGSW